MVPVEMACQAVARTPRCMLWLEITEDGTLPCCLIARRTPTRSSPFSPLQIPKLAPFQSNKPVQSKTLIHGRTNLRNINASPATSLLELTKTLQPLWSKCLRGWPEIESTHHQSQSIENTIEYENKGRQQTRRVKKRWVSNYLGRYV